MSEAGRLIYDGDEDRYYIDDQWGLHCGDVIEVVILDGEGNPKWEAGRVEKESSGWYIVGLRTIELDGLWARFPDNE